MGAGVPEPLLWTYVIQLSAALRAIHANGLAARCVDVSKILVHGKNKVSFYGNDIFKFYPLFQNTAGFSCPSIIKVIR